MKEQRPSFYIASIVICRNPLRYVVSTNSGVAIYRNYDSLPKFCKDFLKVHLDQALALDDVVLVGAMEVDEHD